MNIRYTIYLLTAVSIVACSGNDDTSHGITDERQLTKEQLVSDVPMSFAPVELADMLWLASAVEDITRGGSVAADDFTIDSLGIFCLAKKELPSAPYALSWGSKRINIRWAFNEMAEVKGVGGNKGTIVWGEEKDLHFYPKQDWYTYGFVAYHPWTKYVVGAGTTVKAYFKIDGNDDIIHAIASTPEATLGEDLDNLAFSRSYFNTIRSQGLPWEGTSPKFQFKHVLTRLNFSFRFDENDLPARNLHVDKVEFDEFPCIVQLTLASLDKTAGVVKDMITPSSTIYVKNSNTSELGKVVVDGDTLMYTDPNFASAFGHFELREKGETPISGIREGASFKYNLSSEFKKVGDCILVPPVKDTHSKRDIKLFVTLCDDNGNKFKNSSYIKITCPSTGWLMGKSYDVRITLNAPSGYGTSLAPSMSAASTSTETADGTILWQPKATVTVTPRK